jgi:hypothetical protein
MSEYVYKSPLMIVIIFPIISIMRKAKPRCMTILVNVALFLWMILFSSKNDDDDDSIVSWKYVGRYLQLEESSSPPSRYDQSHLERTVPKLHSFAPRLLVFHDNIFEVYTMKHNSTFYHDKHDFNYRSVTIVPLLVHTLRTHLPHRFAANMPPFQMLFTDSDSLRTQCVNPQEWAACDTYNWAPVLAFGSLVKDAATTFPTVQIMPTPPFMECLYSFIILQHTTQECQRHEPLSGGGGIYQPNDPSSSSSSFDSIDIMDLEPTIVWRGSDYAFLFEYEKFRFWDIDKVLANDDENEDWMNCTKYDLAVRLFQHWNDIGPRWRSIALSLQAELEQEQLIQQQQQQQQQQDQIQHDDSNQTTTTTTTSPNHPTNPTLPAVWINSRFTGSIPFLSEDKIQHLHSLGVHVQESEMTLDRMAMTYRYHLDLGGGGGTSWLGTLSKLRMPGILFHHETPTQDWFHSTTTTTTTTTTSSEDSMIVPWKHYIPIHWDLTDLRAKYDWAQAPVNAHRIRQMSQEATELANYLVSPRYMQQVYETYFIQKIPPIVEAYQEETFHSWEMILQQYRQSGFALQRLAICKKNHCKVQAEATPTVTSIRRLRHRPLGT